MPVYMYEIGSSRDFEEDNGESLEAYQEQL